MQSTLVQPLQQAIDTYYSNERAAMLLFLGFGVVLAVAAVALYMRRDHFPRGLAIVLAGGALLAAGTAIPILVRDGPRRDVLIAAAADPAGGDIMAQEASRMDGVLARYPLLRYTYAALLIGGVLLLVFTRQPLTHGVATGLLVIAVSGFVVDHFSDRRARAYHQVVVRTLDAGGIWTVP